MAVVIAEGEIVPVFPNTITVVVADGRLEFYKLPAAVVIAPPGPEEIYETSSLTKIITMESSFN
jgi:hypothetical protein